MNQSLYLLGYQEIIERLKNHAVTAQAKERCAALEPYLSETELKKNMRETTQARQMLDLFGVPPMPLMEQVEQHVERALVGELLLPEQIAEVGSFLVGVRRLKSYLDKGRSSQLGVAFYGENISLLEELSGEIERCIRIDMIDDYASAALRDIRRQIQLLGEKVREKAERALKANQAYVNDSFVVKRSGRLCIPVKAEYKSRVQGAVIDKSSTGSTLFIEPKAVAELQEAYELYKIEEDTEERRILYGLMEQIAEAEAELREDIRVTVMLDFVFAKGKLSQELDAVEPAVNLERRICLKGARHPMLDKESVVPLDFVIGEPLHGKGLQGNTIRGMIITGPNTGGKTVVLKTVALLSAMACSGLHIPCAEADIAMNSQILCDIGDGQDLLNNLSTFSAHIKNVLEILKRVTPESLVVMDELGSGTDPAEGMGIAIAILEELRKSGALFLVTTHYPEVKEYAGRYEEVVNARMGFDRESLRPLYRLEIGRAGESCALYIAKRLGLPVRMLKTAAKEAYGEPSTAMVRELELDHPDEDIKKVRTPGIRRKAEVRAACHGEEFTRGDSVTVLPDGWIGIVVKPADSHGDVLVQVKKEKILVSHKRLKLKVAATELYPEDYDFSIIFDSVENRKARHQMGKHHQEGLSVEVSET
ncbi:DNA mismatch repair protein MutS [Clostridium sp. AN503]|uniref:endonuclease MutS2 n=1 Tax=Clostridium sp. AN503 TaxID=3160598 RepID=UPI003459DB56